MDNYTKWHKGWRRRSKIIKRTPEEKLQLLQTMNNEVRQGSRVEDVAEKYSVSTSSFYRWWRQKKQLEIENISDKYDNIIDINEVIRSLAFKQNDENVFALESLFKFITWMRWPNKIENHLIGMICCISSYLDQKSESSDIGDAEPRLQRLLFKYLKSDTLRKMCSPDAPFFPDYDALSNTTESASDLDFYARVTEYLISEVASYSTDDYRPTLTRAGKMVDQELFGKRYAMSERTFYKEFKERAATFPFLYIDFYHGGPGISLNPNLPNFAGECDTLVERRNDFHMHFARCAWACNALQSVLPTSTLSRITFPQFPPELKVAVLQRPRLDAELRAKIQEI